MARQGRCHVRGRKPARAEAPGKCSFARGVFFTLFCLFVCFFLLFFFLFTFLFYCCIWLFWVAFAGLWLWQCCLTTYTKATEIGTEHPSWSPHLPSSAASEVVSFQAEFLRFPQRDLNPQSCDGLKVDAVVNDEG